MSDSDSERKFGMLRDMIVLCRLADEDDPRTHAQMLSNLDRIERAGEPCPNYAELLELSSDDLETCAHCNRQSWRHGEFGECPEGDGE